MNDEPEMLALILPAVKNQGEEEKRKREEELRRKALEDNAEPTGNAAAKNPGGDTEEGKEEEPADGKGSQAQGLEEENQSEELKNKRDKEAKLAIMKSMHQICGDFFGGSLVTIPKIYEATNLDTAGGGEQAFSETHARMMKDQETIWHEEQKH
jgi:hypothetical protein